MEKIPLIKLREIIKKSEFLKIFTKITDEHWNQFLKRFPSAFKIKLTGGKIK